MDAQLQEHFFARLTPSASVVCSVYANILPALLAGRSLHDGGLNWPRPHSWQFILKLKNYETMQGFGMPQCVGHLLVKIKLNFAAYLNDPFGRQDAVSILLL